MLLRSHRPPQLVFLNNPMRRDAVVAESRDRHVTGQPLFVGKQSVADSEPFIAALAQTGIEVRALNTVATPMRPRDPPRSRSRRSSG
ncbi:MAG: hypothetical protein ACTH0V_08905 [Microbacteriaceae bacterium]|uniref:preprotein translocase subunit SecA n=1 Tax=Microbacterium sp. JB110 TaxID=2024477 RepID=UPI003FA5646F